MENLWQNAMFFAIPCDLRHGLTPLVGDQYEPHLPPADTSTPIGGSELVHFSTFAAGHLLAVCLGNGPKNHKVNQDL